MLLLAGAASCGVANAQLSKNPDKFLGNITTRYSVDVTDGGKRFVYSDLWNQITPENESKWASIEGSRGSYNWGSDNAYNYAKNHNFPFKFHCLIWGSQYPDWLNSLSTAEQYKAIEKWMDAIKKHYPHIDMIDVVNEAVPGHAPAPYKAALGGDGSTGYDWIIKAFEMAYERWPDAILIYNDYNTFYADKRDAIIRLVKKLNAEEKLCDGVGMQGYIGGYGSQAGCMNPNDIRLIKEAIEKYKALGIEVQLTEVAVRNYDGSESAMASHAEFYGNLFKMLKSVNADGKNQFTGITIWGITDHPGMDENDYSYKMNGPYCGLYTKEYKPKESYKKVYSVLKE